jgi:serine/threonine protein kinase
VSRVKPPKSKQGVSDTLDAVRDEDEGDLPTGTMVGEYRVEKRIGSGGMGMVFAATHPVIGKRVAIKVLKADVCNDVVAVERFIDEARVVNQIEHPNIVDIFAFGQLPDGRHYFVMEWLRGESLRARIERNAMPIARAVELLLPLVRALSAAHEHGIVHRDLKPDNVFIVEARGETVVKLLDFGVAKLSKADLRTKRVGHTATGTIVGTPQYLSPEQAKGLPVDHRADIYALGAIAFETLTGKPPFVAASVMEVVAMHLMEKPSRPSTLVPNVPFELDELVVASLAKDPDERPGLTEWREVLEQVAAQCDVTSEPRVGRTLTATDPAGLPFGAETPLPRMATTPWPRDVTPPPQTPVPSVARKRFPRWAVVALVALPTIAIGIAVLTITTATTPPAETQPARLIVSSPHVEPGLGSAATSAVAIPQPATHEPPIPLAQDSTLHPTVPAAHHHHAHAKESSTTLAPPGPSAAETTDDDLLAPGSIPREGSATAP